MGVSARTEHILLTSLVFGILCSLIIGLTIGLRTPPLPNGGSPTDPPLSNGTTPAPRDSKVSLERDVPREYKLVANHLSENHGKKKLYYSKNDNLINKIEQPDAHNSATKPRHRVTGKKLSDEGRKLCCPVDAAITGEDQTSPAEDLPPWPESVTKSFLHAAVSTDTVPCSKIGVDILRAGGSAVDAAIAAAVCVGVVNHHSCGIGGGHFMTIYEAPRGGDTKEFRTIQAREWAPLAATEDMFVNNMGASTKGGLSIAVPGEVKGYYTAWQRYGRIPWSDLFQPTIRLCEDGFIVERALSEAIEMFEDDIRSDPNLSELFVKKDGSLITEGDLLKNPKLGATLTRIAEDPETFYSGSLADAIIADLTEYGSIITKEDLLAYRAKLKSPTTIHLSNGNLTVYSVTPPSSGVVNQYILNILNGYHFKPWMLNDVDTKALTYHRIIEAFKFAYAKRSNLGDEDFVDVENLVVNLTSPEYGEYIRSRINDNTTYNYTHYEPDFDITVDGGTAHLSVLASDGAAVAMTMTINLFFGSNVRGNRTGIIFNDEMDDFSTPGTENSFGVPASPANYIVPGKMPMSSMCPVLVVNGNKNNNNNNTVVFVSGGAGGTRITTATAFVTMQSIWFNKTLANATDTARIHHQLVPEEVLHEPHLPQGIIDGLRERNHLVTLYDHIAIVNSIANTCQDSDEINNNECIHAVSDGRKGGVPDGI